MELLEEEEHLEVEQYLADAEPLSIYAHPHLYSVQELHVKEFGFMLSSGVEVVAAVLFKGKDRDTKEIIDLLLCKLCKMLRVVHSPQLQSWFNPFEESVADGEHRMPGFWL